MAGARITFVVAALNTGGAERHTVSLRQALAERGLTSDLLAIGKAKSRALFDAPGAQGVIELNAPRLLSRPATWIETAQAIRRLDPEVLVVTNTPATALVAALRGLGLIRSKIVCVFHSTVLDASERASLAAFRVLGRWVDALVYVSATQRRYWEAHGLRARGASVITNGIDLQRFRADAEAGARQRAALGLAPDDYVIGIVAAIRPEKRHHDLVEAVSLLHHRGLRPKLLIVGDGAGRDALQRQSRDLGLMDHVVFAGDQKDVRPFVAACDVCVLCSTIETFSLAALEVLAMGVPLVASDVGAMSEIVEEGLSGLLFPMGDVGALADRLAVLADPQRRSTMASYARASAARFEISGMVDRYERLLAELSSAGPPADCGDERPRPATLGRASKNERATYPPTDR